MLTGGGFRAAYNTFVHTVYSYVPSPGHVYPGHPERPERLELLEPRLGTFSAEKLEVAPATRDQIASVHDQELIAAIEDVCKQGPAVIDYAPTFVNRSSFEDALLAAGGAITCTRAVVGGKAKNAIAVIRPPGHHAEPERAMGFCIFNNIAIAARQALADGLERVMVVDYDAHHGNGTQAVFFNEERVAFISMHQWGIYPGTGWIEDASQAKRRIINVPLGAGAGDVSYGRVMDEIVKPAVEAFRPQMLFVSAGFDAHWSDPITSLGLSTAGYFAMSQKLVGLAEEHCSGKIVFVLEGGYDPQNVVNGATAVFAALAGESSGPDVHDPCPRADPDHEARIREVRSWHGFA